MIDTPELPHGVEFLEFIETLESRTEAETWERLPGMGEKAPRCIDHLGTMLSYLDRLASCAWGCKQGDHVAEFLVGRVVALGYAALRLIRGGYYDEALLIARSLGEIANLLTLFSVRGPEFERWKRLDQKTRRSDFSPANVRKSLLAIGIPLPATSARYGVLSEEFVHAQPGSAPQLHNPRGQPTTIPLFQPAGFLLSLNEVALQIAFIALTAHRLCQAPDKIASEMHELAIRLGDAVGGVTTEQKGRPWFKLN